MEKKTPSENQDELVDQIKVRFETLEKIKNRGENPYKNGIHPDSLAFDLHRLYDESTKEELEEKNKKVSVAGRIMAIRHFGKAGFVRIKDRTGEIQLFVQKNTLGDEGFARYRELDVGDIVYSQGPLFKTKTNELSVHSDSVMLLTKSLRPLPEKYHGIADVEIKYRQRYLDLIMDDHSKDVFRKRFQIVSAIRKFFLEKDFLEVETPMMHPIAGGAAARPFVTHHNTLDMDLFLRIAPELYLKRLVVGGFDRVFEINRNFRNEGISIQHNPEFTMLEFYQAYATFEDLMPLTEELFRRLAKEILGTETLTYQGTEIRLAGSWEKISMEDSLVKYGGFDLPKEKLRDAQAMVDWGKTKGIELNPKDPPGKIMATLYEEFVEGKLIQPTFITHFPADVSPLARRNEQDPFLTDRFELMIYGREVSNGFSELNDPIDQKERFQAQVEAKSAGDEEACDMDTDYVTALEYGMPPTAGQGIGIDRLVMFFTDSPSIRDVILFPQLRSKVH